MSSAWRKRPGRGGHYVQWWVQPEGLSSMGTWKTENSLVSGDGDRLK